MIGEMDTLLVVQREIHAPDAVGQTQPTWVNLKRRWASVESLSTREGFQARQADVVITHKVMVWYWEDLHANAPKRRLVLKGRILNIVSAVQRDRQLELLCTEVQPWGNQA